MPLGRWILLHAVLKGQCPSQLSCDISIFNIWSPRSQQKQEMRVDTLAGRSYGSCQEVQCVTSPPLSIGQNWVIWSNPPATRCGKMSLPMCPRGRWNGFVEHMTQVGVVVWFYLLAPVKISTLNTSASLFKSLVRDSGGINNIIHDVGL